MAEAEQGSDFKQVVQTLSQFVNTPTPNNPTDYKQVCQDLIDEHPIITIFGSLLAEPDSFNVISSAITKVFKSPIGPSLLRDKNVCQWIISGLQQSSNPQYESLNLLAIDILLCSLQNDDDVGHWIVYNESSLFLWSLSLISSPFEASFQKLEKIVNKHCGHPLLLRTLFSENVIEMLLNVKDQNENDSVNHTDRNTMRFRAHALWIGTMKHYYCSNPQNEKLKGDEEEEKMDVDDDDDGNNDDDGDYGDNKNTDILSLYRKRRIIRRSAISLFDDLLGLLKDDDDVLIQTCSLPLLSSFAEFENGLKLLLQKNIVSVLYELLQSDEAMLFGKEIFKVFVSMITNAKRLGLTSSDSSDWLRDKVLFQIIEKGFNFNDAAVQESCCLFVGHFVSIPKSMNLIMTLRESNDSKDPTQTLCKLVVNSTMNPSSESKTVAVAAMHGIAEILGVETVDKEQKEMVQFQRNLLQQIAGMDALYTFLKDPEDEMRFAVFRIIHILCGKRWGIEYSMKCGGLFEYLTDRNEADGMAGYRWRYAICEQMFKNKRSGAVLNQTQKEQLKQYIEEGVVFRDDKGPDGGQKMENVVQLGWEQR